MKRYRLYIDESGDHTHKQLDDPARRYLGLTGCFVEHEAYRTRLHPALEALKQIHFPHDPDYPVILHRSDIVNRKALFRSLNDLENERRFNSDILRFLAEQDYHVITVVIDKKAHVARYDVAAYHPYHYCLATLLERYCAFLNQYNAQGDVMAEGRGGAEDRQLKDAYQNIYRAGTRSRNAEFFQRVLTSNEIKIKRKEENIAGLQVSDLLAYPCKQEILASRGQIVDPGDVFGKAICQCIGPKYNARQEDGQIDGYGRVFLG